ncbi:MAG: diadenylate cyclase [Mariprofundaceae bacterium]|nr:diadenylate cyclase [Mariprofundaceae bacterium]
MNDLIAWAHSQLTLLDLVDIFVVAVVVYFALRLIRGTRAEQMLIGLAVLFVVYKAARAFDLLTVEWMFSQFFSAFIVIFVVLFQSEIRRGLMHVAANPWAPSPHSIEDMVEELIASSQSLIRRKWGGTIVIERETGLKHLMESGVNIEAPLSPDVIQTLFCPHTPLHDGAVIVQNGSHGVCIVAARVLLPLAQANSLPGGFGTRHRSAVGVTEESDALVLVISEERGEIHIARDGILTPALKGDILRVELLRHLKNT